MGYGDYVIGDSVISRVYYVEGLGHNLFFVGQFCDSDMEVAFRKHSCYVRDTDGVDLIKCSRGSNLYTISVEDMMKSCRIYLLSKSSKNKSWLRHRRLNHLNFGKSKKHTHKPKTENTNLEVLNTLHMDLYGPMHMQTINGKKYILVVIDDYSRFMWVKFLRSKDETLEVVIKFLKQIQVGLNKTNFSPKDNFEDFTAERRCRKTELYSCRGRSDNADIFQCSNVSLGRSCGYGLKPDLTFFHVFGALCYPTNDSDDLGKLQPTTDIGISVGYAPSKKGYRIYNKRTCIRPALTFLTPGQISLGLVPNPVPAAPYVPPTNKELEILFQPMFDEYLKPPHVERPVSLAPAVLIPITSDGTPSSTSNDQDAPSPSHSPSTSVSQPPGLHQGVSAEPTIIEDNPFSPVDIYPFVNVFTPEPSSEASSSGDVSLAESTHVTQTHHHLRK
ncbi:retrovirus-related pol polyprotein from transposon TNT 1-94 [Tanacetum coccineum]